MEEKNLEKSAIYELGYHLLPTIAEDDLGGKVESIHNIISKNSGSIIGEGSPELRALSYPISKRYENKREQFSKGYFGWVKFEMPSSSVGEVEKMVKDLEEILRFIIIKTVRENTMYSPKVSAQKKDQVDGAPVSASSESSADAPVSEEEIDKSIDELVIS